MLEVVGVDEDRDALALDDAAQRAADGLHHALGLDGERAADTFSASCSASSTALRLEPLGDARRLGRQRAGGLLERLGRAAPAAAERLGAAGLVALRARGLAQRLGLGLGAREHVGGELLGAATGDGRAAPRRAPRAARSRTRRRVIRRARPRRPPPREMTIAPASSRRRTTPTMRPWASSTTRRALRRLELDLLAQHLGAALGHVREDLAADLLGHAAQGDREVLLVDLLEHQLDRAVVELDDVLEGEQQQPDLLGQLARSPSRAGRARCARWCGRRC